MLMPVPVTLESVPMALPAPPAPTVTVNTVAVPSATNIGLSVVELPPDVSEANEFLYPPAPPPPPVPV